jgi:2-dehydro-3-deoxygluconokinase
VDALSFGEALVAFTAADGHPLRSAAMFRRTVVGAEFHVAAGLARLGHRVQFAGRVGDDPLGQVVEEACRAQGIEGHLERDAGSFTGVLVRDMQTSRPTVVAYARSASAGSRLSVEDLAGCAVKEARLLHTTGITAVLSPQSLEAVRWAMASAHGAGVRVSFDPNVRWRLMHPVHTRPVLASLLDNVDVLLAGADELVWLAGREDIDEATTWALDRGPRLVVVKDGARGARATDATGTAHFPAVPVDAVDPVGAGDAFAAGFLSGVLNGRTIEKAMAEAHGVAALVVATFTGQSGAVHR